MCIKDHTLSVSMDDYQRIAVSSTGTIFPTVSVAGDLPYRPYALSPCIAD